MQIEDLSKSKKIWLQLDNFLHINKMLLVLFADAWQISNFWKIIEAFEKIHFPTFGYYLIKCTTMPKITCYVPRWSSACRSKNISYYWWVSFNFSLNRSTQVQRKQLGLVVYSHPSASTVSHSTNLHSTNLWACIKKFP